MIICHSKKYIFIHINKCGGSSVTRALLPTVETKDIVLGGVPEYESNSEEYSEKYGIYKHSTAQEVRSFVGNEIWEDYYKFAVVRNPWDKIMSTYFWFHKTGWGKGGKGDHIRSMSFSDYISSRYMDEKGCADFLLDENGALMVDEVFSFEKIESCISYLKGRFGIPWGATPRENTTDHKHYSAYYDQYTQNVVARRYSADVSLFGFEFDRKPSKYFLSDKDVNFLRDLAISESEKDIFLAEKLMSLASLGRPDGSLIKEKLFEYRAKING